MNLFVYIPGSSSGNRTDDSVLRILFFTGLDPKCHLNFPNNKKKVLKLNLAQFDILTFLFGLQFLYREVLIHALPK